MNKKLIFLITSVIVFILNLTLSFDIRIFFIALITLGIATFITFGYKKDNLRYKKDILIKVITYLLCYYLIIYLLGLIVGFVKTGYSFALVTVIKNVLPFLILIFASELIRYMLIEKNKKSILNLIIIGLLFSLIDVNLYLYSYHFNTDVDVLEFVLIVVLPIIMRNGLFTYLSFNVGYRIPIVYRLINECLVFFVPFIPNFGKYIQAVIDIILPSIIALLVYRNYKKIKWNKIDSRRIKNKNYLVYIPIVMIIGIIIFLTSGMFKYYALTIGSGSMTGSINKGDVIIVKKLTDTEKDNIDIGEVLVFNYDNKVIVHRVINIIEIQDVRIFYTKGDYNEAEDGYPIYYESIIGVTEIRVPFIGYPTVWLSELIKD